MKCLLERKLLLKFHTFSKKSSKKLSSCPKSLKSSDTFMKSLNPMSYSLFRMKRTLKTMKSNSWTLFPTSSPLFQIFWENSKAWEASNSCLIALTVLKDFWLSSKDSLNSPNWSESRERNKGQGLLSMSKGQEEYEWGKKISVEDKLRWDFRDKKENRACLEQT